MCGKVFKTHDELSEHHSIVHSQQVHQINGSVSGDSVCENEEDGVVANSAVRSNRSLTANVERDRRKVGVCCNLLYMYV